MDMIGSVVTAGAVVLGIALMAFAVGKTMVSLPAFGGGLPTSTGIETTFNTTMAAVNVNSATAFSILSVSPLVLGAAIIISLLVGAFVVYKATD